jgi:hypothetical protein
MNRHPNANNLRPRPQITQPADPSYRIIALTQNQVTLVDTGDYDNLMKWHWYAWWNTHAKCFYAVRTMTLEEDGCRGRIYMQRFILNAPAKFHVDHRDQCSLNNRRYNLRIATASQNGCNRGAQVNNKCGFKGVCWSRKDKRWGAYIKINRKVKFLGYSLNPEDAARAYDTAARELHGEFACLNFPLP